MKNTSNNNYKNKIYANKVFRRDYSKIENNLEMPNLLEVQKNSFEKFLSCELESVVKSIFPITSPRGKYTLNFKNIIIGETEKDIEKCRFESSTFSVPLYVNFELVNNETGEVKLIKKSTPKKGEKTYEGIFFGNIPMMTPKCTFVINGIEKFVISQIIRSPGLYVLNKSQIKLNNSRKKIIENGVCEILPYKGSLILINTLEEKKYIQFNLRSVNGEQSVAIMATTLLKAYGLSQQNILDIYGADNEFILETLKQEKYNPEEILEDKEIKKIKDELSNDTEKDLAVIDIDTKLSYIIQEIEKIDNKYKETNDEVLLYKKEKLLWQLITEKAAKDVCNSLGLSTKTLENFVDSTKICYQALLIIHLFTERYYDLSSAGRYKINKKLKISERLYKKTIAQDILVDGTPIIKESTFLSKEEVNLIKKNFKENKNLNLAKTIKIENPFFDFKTKLDYLTDEISFESIDVYDAEHDNKQKVRIIGTIENNIKPITIVDLIASISYSYNLRLNIGNYDDIDHLGNKRLKLIHEQLKNKLAVGMIRIEKGIIEKLAIAEGDDENNLSTNPANENEQLPEVTDLKKESFTIKSIINTNPFQIILKEFFNSYQLIQFIDQQNPLSELTNKRRISAMGPGGISREDPNLDIRDVHNSQYGRICPIETPEGMNIGLILSLASYAKVDENGFIQTPYRKVVDGVVTDEIRWMTPHEDDEYAIADSNVHLDENKKILDKKIVVRFRGTTQLFDVKDVDYIDVTPKQVISVASSLIPFLENDDANRALMGANMQRQAVPLINPNAPWVGTGSEYKIGHDSGAALVCENEGTVTAMDGNKIIVTDDQNNKTTYDLVKYRKSNQNTCNNQIPIVELDQKVKKGDILADGPAMQNGELSIGRNVLVGFTTWGGYNFEDAIILSERLVNEDVYTSIHITEYKVQCMQTKNGDEEITREIPNISESAKKYLNEDGIIKIGAEVKEGDVLVGKITPRAKVDLPPEEKLLYTIFGEKTKSLKESSLKVPHGGEGTVIDVKRFKNYDSSNAELGDDVIEVIKVYIAQKRKIQVGDKMAGRHGNKGIVSKIVPLADMPFLDNGTPLDILLNPLGVPSRMNIGQILELHLGLCTLELGKKELIRKVYENKPISELVQIYGFKDIVATKLFNLIQNHIKTINASSFDELIKQISNNDLLIILNQIGLNFDDIGYKVATPVFEGVKKDDLISIMNESGLQPETTKGKFKLRDGKTGDYFDGDIAVGVMYMLKLDHMVDDKIHARSVGPYSKITQQPLGGKSQNGGQRFGEMEVWALEAYGAAYNLHEILTIKSDDVRGRNRTYNAITKGQKLPSGSTPESFKLLTKKLQGLGLYLEVTDQDDKVYDINNYIASESLFADDEQREYSELLNDENSSVCIKEQEYDDDEYGI